MGVRGDSWAAQVARLSDRLEHVKAENAALRAEVARLTEERDGWEQRFRRDADQFSRDTGAAVAEVARLERVVAAARAFTEAERAWEAAFFSEKGTVSRDLITRLSAQRTAVMAAVDALAERKEE